MEKTIKALILILVLSGCICLSQKNTRENVIIYEEVFMTSTTIKPETTSTSMYDWSNLGSTTKNIKVNIVTNTSTTTTTTHKKSVSNSAGSWSTLTSTTIKAPILDVPYDWQRCNGHTDCTLVTDCCGRMGRQYAINSEYLDNWANYIQCTNNVKCITNVALINYRYHYTICNNKTCEKSRNKPY